MVNALLVVLSVCLAVQVCEAQLAMYLINDFVNTLNGNKPISEGLTAGIDLNTIISKDTTVKQQISNSNLTAYKKRMSSFGRIPMQQLVVEQAVNFAPVGVVASPTLPDVPTADDPSITVIGSPSMGNDVAVVIEVEEGERDGNRVLTRGQRN